jgi:2-amino-4-hydroxy-6-hydroxymethyldihydropteridine diphosphokinase
MNLLLLALGANIPGRWGSPRDTLRRACRELAAAGIDVVRVSNLYATEPLGGGGRQPRYLNAVIVAQTRLPPGLVLRRLKNLERRAGRRPAPPMRARPLDLDILDYGGRRLGRAAAPRRHGGLILPHPELHKRAFVLVPLLEVAPWWRHPSLAAPAGRLLARLGPRARSGVQRTLDLAGGPCEK